LGKNALKIESRQMNINSQIKEWNNSRQLTLK
jgi:hypothetical protein